MSRRALFLCLPVALVLSGATAGHAQSKARARDLGVPFDGAPGPNNAITDVAGVEVGQVTLISGEGPRVIGKGPIRTGVTAIHPRGRNGRQGVFAAFAIGNGNGDMTGTHWIQEAGVLETPVLITNTLSVGVVRDAAVEWMVERDSTGPFWYPVVAETSDGLLNDMKGQHVTRAHALQALDSAAGGRVAEGNVGGGTGMNCNGFKGGTGTSSRVLGPGEGGWTVGVLVQCNYGSRSELRIAGVNVGRDIQGFENCVARRLEPPQTNAAGQPLPVCDRPPGGEALREDPEQGSIIVVVATDAPLTPDQLQRVVQRVSLGMGRLGSIHGNGSGDIFVAFSTANRGADDGNSAGGGRTAPATVVRLTANQMDPLFLATVRATEEAIVNAMIAAETMTGADYHRRHAIPHDQLRAILKAHGVLRGQ
ncbi:MAG: P1 family peptidase [Acidobacteria bacterium]|nr:P1 family peptidase [Acidobacteriota bacterium]